MSPYSPSATPGEIPSDRLNATTLLMPRSTAGCTSATPLSIKKVCPGTAGTYPAFHISFIRVTSAERRTSPAALPLLWRRRTYQRARRS